MKCEWCDNASFTASASGQALCAGHYAMWCIYIVHAQHGMTDKGAREFAHTVINKAMNEGMPKMLQLADAMIKRTALNVA